MNDSNVTIVVKNPDLNKMHYLTEVVPSTHFHDLLIKYCRNHCLDFKNYVFLVPCDVTCSNNISWKVATPSMRVSDCIFDTTIPIFLDPIFNFEGRRIYVQCVQKQCVSNFVAWNNCLSLKYSKSLKSDIETAASIPTQSKKKAVF